MSILELLEREREEAEEYAPLEKEGEEWSELEWAEYLKRCQECRGLGWVFVGGRLEGRPISGETCPACGGSGRR